jgi:hypothetical protein
MLNFIIALAVQPIFIFLTLLVNEGVHFIHDEICAEANNFEKWKQQAKRDAEWQWKLLRKDIEKWQKR